MTRARILADYVSSGDELADKAPIAGPTFTGTVAIPNVANLETAVVANTAKVTNYNQTLADINALDVTELGTVTSGNLSNTAIVYPAGHVRQVLYDQQTASDSNTFVTSSTYVPIVGLSQDITILASSKVYIHTNIHLYIQNNTANNWSTANLKIFRDSTEVHLPAGTNPYVHGRYTTDASDRSMTFVPLSYLDTPGSAGTYTYTVKISSKNGFSVGSSPTDQMGFSNITLMEITG